MVELLVTMGVVGLLLALVLPIVLSNRRTVELDQVRTGVNQTLRAAHDLIAADIRISGERFNEIGLGILSPVELGADASGSVLVLRRALEDWLPVCDDDPLTGTTITVAVIGELEPQRCIAQRTVASGGVDWPPSVLAWRSALLPANRGTVYIHDRVSGLGQYFVVATDPDAPLEVQCVENCTWNASAGYSDPRGAIIGLLEVFEYRVDDGVLVRRNAVTGDELRIADGIVRFAVTITRDDGTGTNEVVAAFAASASWARIRSVNVTLAVALDQGGTRVEREMTVEYFPRNALSR